MGCSGMAAIRIRAISPGAIVTPGAMDTRGAVVTHGVAAIRGVAATHGVATSTRAKLAPEPDSRSLVMRRHMWHAMCACALFAALGIVDVKASGPEALPEARPMYFEHLTTRDGLSQSTVMSILQDSQGYLWIGTESGLNRYDGYSIREYRRERGSGAGLANDYVWAIAEDAQSNLWLATVGGGIARWDRRTDRFQHFRHDPADPGSLANDKVRSLMIDAQGRIWAGHF